MTLQSMSTSLENRASKFFEKKKKGISNAVVTNTDDPCTKELPFKSFLMYNNKYTLTIPMKMPLKNRIVCEGLSRDKYYKLLPYKHDNQIGCAEK